MKFYDDAFDVYVDADRVTLQGLISVECPICHKVWLTTATKSLFHMGKFYYGLTYNVHSDGHFQQSYVTLPCRHDVETQEFP